MHMLAAVNNICFDYHQHQPLSKLLLILICVDSIVCIIVGTIRASAGDINGHIDAMVACYIFSTEGAGTIRVIANTQEIFGLGPTNCPLQAAECSYTYSYCWRLLWTRALSIYYLFLHTVTRNDKNLMMSFLVDFTTTSFYFWLFSNEQRLHSINRMLQVNTSLFFSVLISARALMRMFVLFLSSEESKRKIKIQKSCSNFENSKNIK